MESIQGRNHSKTFAMERPRSMTGIGRVRAIEDYVGHDETELSFSKDSLIFLKEMDEAGWGYGVVEDYTGNTGWFPLSYVQALDRKATDALKGKSQSSIDSKSILESKEAVSGKLASALPRRPTAEEVFKKNIILSTDMKVDPLQQIEKRKEAAQVKKESLTSFLRHKIIKTSSGPKREPGQGPLFLSKERINFHDKTCDIGDVVFDAFEVKSTDGSKVKFKFEFNDYNQPFLLKFDPPSGTVSKNKTVQINVSVTVKVLNTKEIKVNVVSDKDVVANLTVAVKCIKGVFGVNPLELEMTEDNGLYVPVLLSKLKHSLVLHNAFSKEGIFRLASSAETFAQLRRMLDKDMKQFKDHSDVFTVATLIKVWFRELPIPLLSHFKKEDLYLEDPNEVRKVLEKVAEPERSLLEWLIQMIEEIAEKKDENKMTIENLSIVISPNLYKVGAEVDPMEGLILTQKSAKFFEVLVKLRMEDKKKGFIYQSKNIPMSKPPLPKRPPNLSPMSKEELAALRQRASSLDKITRNPKPPDRGIRVEAVSTMRYARTPPPKPPPRPEQIT